MYELPKNLMVLKCPVCSLLGITQKREAAVAYLYGEISTCVFSV